MRHRKAERDHVKEVAVDVRYHPEKAENLKQRYEMALRRAAPRHQGELDEVSIYSVASFSHEVRPGLLRLPVRPRGPEADTMGQSAVAVVYRNGMSELGAHEIRLFHPRKRGEISHL
jgi:hypothetical protein